MLTDRPTRPGPNGMTPQVDARERVVIPAPRFEHLVLRLRGTAPLLQERFSEKARTAMRGKQEAGSTARSKRVREARDFGADFRAATHRLGDGRAGVSAAAFRNACITACSVVGFHMTKAKMSVFVEADGLDAEDGTPLVALEADEPEMSVMPTRNATGVADLRARPLWRSWAVTLRLLYDADQFTRADVVNLVNRAGMQVGVGAGRPYSKASNGMGYGTFAIVSPEEER